MKGYKIVLVGDEALEESKTLIISREMAKDMCPDDLARFGSAYHVKRLKTRNDTIKLHTWDTSGRTKFMSLTQDALRTANVVIAVFSLTDRESLQHIEEIWIPAIRNVRPSVPIILCGTGTTIRNKNDKALLKKTDKWEPVEYDLGVSYKDRLNLQEYYEIKFENPESLENLYIKSYELATNTIYTQ